MRLDLISTPLGAYGRVHDHHDPDRAPSAYRAHRAQRAVRPPRAWHPPHQRPPGAAADVLLRRAHQFLPPAVGDADVRRVGGRRECRGRRGDRVAHAGHRAGRARLAQAHAALRLPRPVRPPGPAARPARPCPARPPPRGPDRPRQARLGPPLVSAATPVPAGVLAAFLPLAAGVSGSGAALGLFAQAVASTVGRWWAGRHGDRHGHSGLPVPGLLTATAGMTILIWVAAPTALIAGMCLFGIGFGITQNVTFALLIDRAPVSGYGTASALWNLAYDAGYGAGPAVFGVFVAYTGYPAAFGLTGMLMLAALVPAARDRVAKSHNPADPPPTPRTRATAPTTAARRQP